MDIGIFLVLVLFGYVFGKIIEKKHYSSIKQREDELRYIPTICQKHPLQQNKKVKKVVLVNGNVVISIDYFKKILASLRNFFGGNVQAYETLLDRARREAVLRLKESCKDADEIINLRLETSSISKSTQGVGSIEVLAYATAIYYEK
ncbi:MAG: heavy metal-binding domain-containing protein [Campylobacteraceae bacterium]|nr:heavy metal-binding domain-containing protein [Campylobacteraceae bacterium]